MENGIKAFPCVLYVPCSCGKSMEITGHYGGMFLRDWFAGIASDKTVEQSAQAFLLKNDVKECLIAEARYFYADQMLRERIK